MKYSSVQNSENTSVIPIHISLGHLLIEKKNAVRLNIAAAFSLCVQEFCR